MYSKQEVEELLENTKSNVTSSMDNEISYYLNMNGNLVM